MVAISPVKSMAGVLRNNSCEDRRAGDRWNLGLESYCYEAAPPTLNRKVSSQTLTHLDFFGGLVGVGGGGRFAIWFVVFCPPLTTFPTRICFAVTGVVLGLF